MGSLSRYIVGLILIKLNWVYWALCSTKHFMLGVLPMKIKSLKGIHFIPPSAIQQVIEILQL